ASRCANTATSGLSLLESASASAIVLARPTSNGTTTPGNSTAFRSGRTGSETETRDMLLFFLDEATRAHEFASLRPRAARVRNGRRHGRRKNAMRALSARAWTCAHPPE